MREDRKSNWQLVVAIVVAVLVSCGFVGGLRSSNRDGSPTPSSDSVVQTTGSAGATSFELSGTTETTSEQPASIDEQVKSEAYKVVSVVDGDTIKVYYQGALTSVRLIGVNTPETVDPRKSVECFGKEASNYLKNKLNGRTVRLVTDSTQTDRDKYNRLLRYVYLGDEDVNLAIIASGYGYEYTYSVPYQKQAEYRAAQKSAESSKKGLWADNACVAQSAAGTTDSSVSNGGNTVGIEKCDIKGNINSRGERIYHVPGQRYYDRTKINTSAGERWFCSERDAVSAGWRKSKV